MSDEKERVLPTEKAEELLGHIVTAAAIITGAGLPLATFFGQVAQNFETKDEITLDDINLDIDRAQVVVDRMKVKLGMPVTAVHDPNNTSITPEHTASQE